MSKRVKNSVEGVVVKYIELAVLLTMVSVFLASCWRL